MEGRRIPYTELDAQMHDTREMRRDFLYCDTVQEMWDDIQKYSEEHTHDWRIYELNVQASQARQGGDNGPLRILNPWSNSIF